MLYKMLLISGVLYLTLLQNNCVYDRGPRYDIRQIFVGQRSVYFKREIGGRNYEGLSISSDGTLCNGPSPQTDFFVDSETIGKVFYRVEGDVLQIYSQSVFTAPQAVSFPAKIVQTIVPPAEFSEEKAKGLGYTELVFADDALKFCN